MRIKHQVLNGRTVLSLDAFPGDWPLYQAAATAMCRDEVGIDVNGFLTRLLGTGKKADARLAGILDRWADGATTDEIGMTDYAFMRRHLAKSRVRRMLADAERPGASRIGVMAASTLITERPGGYRHRYLGAETEIYRELSGLPVGRLPDDPSPW